MAADAVVSVYHTHGIISVLDTTSASHRRRRAVSVVHWTHPLPSLHRNHVSSPLSDDDDDVARSFATRGHPSPLPPPVLQHHFVQHTARYRHPLWCLSMTGGRGQAWSDHKLARVG